MNFPFVTRTRLEYEQRHVKLLKTMLQEAHDDKKVQDERYDKLVETIVEMKREGFEPPPKMIELVPEKDLPDLVWEAINEVSAKNSREYYTHMAYAHEAVSSGTEVEQIVHGILYGQELDV